MWLPLSCYFHHGTELSMFEFIFRLCDVPLACLSILIAGLYCVNCDSIIVIINQLLSLFFFFKTALSILVSLYRH